MSNIQIVYTDTPNASNRLEDRLVGLGGGGSSSIVVDLLSTSGNVDPATDIQRVDATSGDVVVTLPLASTYGSRVLIVARDDGTAHTITIAPTAPDTLTGPASLTIGVQGDWRELVSDGASWRIYGAGGFTPTQITDLTDGGDSTLHYHATDRDRANHTGTQGMATITSGTTSDGVLVSSVTILAAADKTDLTDGGETTLHTHPASGITSGVVATTVGGTGLASYASGDTVYASATNTLSKLAGNATTTKKFLTQSGNGTTPSAPAWATIAPADLGSGTPDNTKVLYGDGTWAPPPGAGAGEANTLGLESGETGGVSAIGTKTGTVLGLYGFAAGSAYLSATRDTTNKNVVFTPNVGTTSNTLAAGDDSRIVNSLNLAVHTIASQAVGDLLYASSAAAWARLAGNATTAKLFLTQSGNGTSPSAPAWGALVSGDLPTVPETKGGTNQTSYTTGDTLYASATNTLSKLAGNATTTKKFLTQTGDGANSAAPAWGTLASGDLPTVPETKGGTNQTAYTKGDLLYSSAANTLSKLAIGSSGTVLTVSAGVPVWSAPSSATVAQATKTANYTVLVTDQSLFGDATSAAFTFTLPTLAAAATHRFTLTKIDSSANAITIAANGAETFGAYGAALTLGVQDDSVTIEAGPTAWRVIAITSTRLGVTTTTANLTLGIQHAIVRVNTTPGPITITLPAATAATVGRMYLIEKITSDANAVTIARSGTDTINGATSYTLTAQYTSVELVGAASGAWEVTGTVQSGVSGTVAPTSGGTGITSYTTGDTLYASATNTLAKLAGNTTTTRKFQAQTGDGVNSAAPVWAQPTLADVAGGTATGSGYVLPDLTVTKGVTRSIATTSANLTLTLSHDIVRVNTAGGQVTITLPAASTAVGKVFNIKKITSDANAVVISRAGADTLEYTASLSLSAQGDCYTIVGATTTSWEVI